MPRYEYACKSWEVSWELEADIGQAPKTPDCPKCEDQGFRYYGNQYINISFGDDGKGNKDNGAMDFHTVKQRYKKFAKEGYDKDAAERFYKTSIDQTKRHIMDETARYKPMYVQWDKLAEQGRAKKLSDVETGKKLEKARKLTAEAYDKAGLDPSKPQKQT